MKLKFSQRTEIKFVLNGFVFFMIMLCCRPCVPDCFAEEKVYKIATVAWIGWSPLHVCQEKGFWREQNVSVEVLNYDDPIIILEAIKAGRIDFAMDMAGSLAGIYMNGTPVVALAETDWSHGGDKIIIKRGQTLRQHVGKPLGVFLDLPSCHFFLGSYLKTRNLKLSDFRIVELGPDDMTQQFIANRLPVIVNYDPWALQAIDAGDGVVLADSSDYEGCIPECFWGYRTHVRNVPDEDIKKILRGWIKAVRWVHDPKHWEAYKGILNKRTFAGHRPYSDAALKQIFASVKIHNPKVLLQRNRDHGGFHQYLEKLRIFLKENGLLKKDFSPEDIFDNRYIMAVLQEPPQ